jgi:hypothetical protein
MMNPRIPTPANIAELLALAEVLGVPAAKKAVLETMAQSLAEAQAAFAAANDKTAEAHNLLAEVSIAKTDLAAREKALTALAARVKESHDSINGRLDAVAVAEANLVREKAVFAEDAANTEAGVSFRENAATARLEKAEALMVAAVASKTEYETKLARLKAAVGE